MKKIKKMFIYSCVFLIFMLMTVATLTFIAGAFKFAVCLIENKAPEFLEIAGMSLVACLGGAFGLIWFIIDTE